jgi:hypothetical protein
MHVEAVGICLLGVYIGYLGWYFVVRIAANTVTADTFASVAAVLVGGVVLSFLDDHLARKGDVWWYPIGLVIGFALYVVFWGVNAKWGKVTPTNPDGKIFPTVAGVFRRPHD